VEEREELMLVCRLIFAVMIALGRLCPDTPLGALINRAVLGVWSALTSGRAWWKLGLALAAVLIFAVLAQGTPYVFAIGAAVDAVAYIDLAGILLAASLTRLAFIAVRSTRAVGRPMILRGARWMRGFRYRAGRAVRTAAARLARQPDADDEPAAWRLGLA
jgi:hypothetical protein